MIGSDRTLVYLVFLLTNLVPGQKVYHNPEVVITAKIRSHSYIYTVKNLSDSPLTYFEINHYNAYNFLIPQGWQKEVSDAMFKAWTDDTKYAILRGTSKKFSMRASSKSGTLGRSSAKIAFDSGHSVIISNVWTPMKEPHNTRVTIIVTLMLLVLGHFYTLRLRSKKNGDSLSCA